ncbi:MAG: hypothetical protein ABSG68_22505 [Thermoguttaceae bacterium]
MNLRERFGRRYRVEYEESYFAQYGLNARVDDPWLQIIPCQYGHIYPWGVDRLAASTDRRGGVARRIAALAFIEVWQDGDDGITALFPLDKFDEVAALMKPRRRRQMTEEQRRAAVERLAKYAFTHARQRRRGGPQALETAETV